MCGDTAVIDIDGDCTESCMDVLATNWKEATSKGAKNVVFNFNDICVVDGRGMEFLMKLFSEQKQANQIIAISGISENLKSVFLMVGLAKFARIFKTKEETLAGLSQ